MAAKRRNGSSAPNSLALNVWDHVQCQVDLLRSEFNDKYDQILTLLANGHSPSKIKAWTGIETDVIRRIRDLHPETLDQLKQHLAANLAEAAQSLSERLIENAHRLRPENIAKALAIAVDKHQLLSGGVTARTEHRTVPTPEELEAMFAALPRANAVVLKDKEE